MYVYVCLYFAVLIWHGCYIICILYFIFAILIVILNMGVMFNKGITFCIHFTITCVFFTFRVRVIGSRPSFRYKLISVLYR